MARARSVAYVRDSASIPFFYSKNDPSTGAPFGNLDITGCNIAVYNVADGTSLLASTPMAYDSALGGYRYNWSYTGTARYVLAVMTPTRAAGVSAALTPIDREVIDLADTLERIDTVQADLGDAGAGADLHTKLGAFTGTENLKAILGNLSTTKRLGEVLGAFSEANNLAAAVGTDNVTSLQARLGGFTATENLKAILGNLSTTKRLGQVLGGFTETANLKATVGSYDNTSTLKTALDEIRGTSFSTATDSLHQLRQTVDALQSSVDALDAGTSTTFVVPDEMTVPESGNRGYDVFLRVYDDNGALINADLTPTLEFIGTTPSGVNLSTFSQEMTNEATPQPITGKYKATITINFAAAPDTAFTVAAKYARTDAGATQNYEFLRPVLLTDDGADHDLIYADTQAILQRIGEHTDTGAANTVFGRLIRGLDSIEHADYGLSALNTDLNTIIGELGNATYGLSALNSDLDLLLARLGVDGSAVTVHEKLGALTAVNNLYSILGTGFNATDTLKAILGSFSTTNTVKHNIEVIQGHVGN